MAWKNDQVSEAETAKIVEVARECLALLGDFVEMGCYRGDTSLMLAEILKGAGNEISACVSSDNRGRVTGVACGKPVEKPGKKLWIYDSFEGLPEKSEVDESVLGVDFRAGELTVTKREVKERFLRAGLPVPVIKKGWFAELTEEDLPSEIAMAFLDGDFYESIRDSLKLVTPKMVASGVIIVHDYNNLALPGVKRAVDEWVATGGLTVVGDFGTMVLLNKKKEA